jgi:hypothetical protein
MALSGPSQNRKRSPLRGVKQTLVTRWTIPIGGGIGRIFKIGSQPLNATLQAYYDVEKPDVTGADWQLRAQLVFLFPTGH